MVTALKEEILEATNVWRNAENAVAITSSLDDPTQLSIRDRMSALTGELLDRTGLIKTEKVQVETSGGVMLMPLKIKKNEKQVTR